MISRVLEAFFRHKLLVILAAVVIPLVVGAIALLTAPVTYDAYAGIWVDRPAYLAYRDDGNVYLSPAQNQSARLAEVLRTRSFQVEVARRTSLSRLVGSTQGEERLRTLLSNGLSIVPGSRNLLVLHFSSDSPQLAYQVITAIVETFKDNAMNDRINQAGIATAFYETRLQGAQEELARANNGLRQYLAASTRVNDPSRAAAAGIPGATVDPQLAELQRTLQFHQGEVDRLRTSLEQARFEASASLEGQELGFQVVDPPQVPTTGTRALRRRLIYPVAGLVIGLGLGASLLVLLVATDRSIHSEADLPPSLRVLGTLPGLRPRRMGEKGGADATRQLVGLAAGAALPGPDGTL